MTRILYATIMMLATVLIEHKHYKPVSFPIRENSKMPPSQVFKAQTAIPSLHH
eukprot:SAG31_NODE_17108_length_683_cov_1.061644_1_plen_52_part_10